MPPGSGIFSARRTRAAVMRLDRGDRAGIAEAGDDDVDLDVELADLGAIDAQGAGLRRLQAIHCRATPRSLPAGRSRWLGDRHGNLLRLRRGIDFCAARDHPEGSRTGARSAGDRLEEVWR
ncbi:MAG TPA: hypothetical protein VFA22_11970 [Stellaceae bacterium]|nr:hypothetical protein [Stellaceae bacterium]